MTPSASVSRCHERRRQLCRSIGPVLAGCDERLGRGSRKLGQVLGERREDRDHTVARGLGLLAKLAAGEDSADHHRVVADVFQRSADASSGRSPA